jgi:hypothetical protein
MNTKKQQIRELAEEASQNGNKVSTNKKKDVIKIQSEVMKELGGKDVKIMQRNITSEMSAEMEDEYEGDEGEEEDEDENNKVEKDTMPEFKENVVKFVKMDDLIRIKMEEIKELKEQKKPYEEYILGFLEKKDAPFVNIKTGKLIRNKSETKTPLKLDIIKESIVEGIKSENNMEAASDTKYNDITEKIIELMNSKRVKTTRTNLKRTFVREKKKNKE